MNWGGRLGGREGELGMLAEITGEEGGRKLSACESGDLKGIYQRLRACEWERGCEKTVCQDRN